MTIQDLVAEVIKDADYYQNSGGGVTLSGGEPLLQWEFCRELAQDLRQKEIHLAVDTAGFVSYESFEAVLPFIDLFLYDIKFYESVLHEKYTGYPNALIKENLEKLIHAGATVIVRIPLIPGLHNEPELEQVSRYLYGKKIEGVELLPYHDMGVHKYYSLGIEKPWLNKCRVEKREQANAIEIFKRCGIQTTFH